MMDLIFGYLIIIICLFSANIGLLLDDFNINNMLAGIIITILTVSVMFISNYFTESLSFLLTNIGFMYLIISVILFLIYVKAKNKAIPLVYFITLFLTSIFVEFSLANVMLAVMSLAIILAISWLSGLLKYAKRPYDVIVGEYMCLMDILIFILGLTYQSIFSLDYDSFTSFLILTPTYKIVYVAIGCAVLLIIGLYYNDRQMKKRF